MDVIAIPTNQTCRIDQADAVYKTKKAKFRGSMRMN